MNGARKRHNMLYGVSQEQMAIDAALSPLKKCKNSTNNLSKKRRKTREMEEMQIKEQDLDKSQLINVVDNSDDEKSFDNKHLKIVQTNL